MSLSLTSDFFLFAEGVATFAEIEDGVDTAAFSELEVGVVVSIGDSGVDAATAHFDLNNPISVDQRRITLGNVFWCISINTSSPVTVLISFILRWNPLQLLYLLLDLALAFFSYIVPKVKTKKYEFNFVILPFFYKFIPLKYCNIYLFFWLLLISVSFYLHLN